jgi:hypothetical protein
VTQLFGRPASKVGHDVELSGVHTNDASCGLSALVVDELVDVVNVDQSESNDSRKRARYSSAILFMTVMKCADSASTMAPRAAEGPRLGLGRLAL